MSLKRQFPSKEKKKCEEKSYINGAEEQGVFCEAIAHDIKE